MKHATPIALATSYVAFEALGSGPIGAVVIFLFVMSTVLILKSSAFLCGKT